MSSTKTKFVITNRKRQTGHSKTALARLLGTSRPTIAKYLALPGAPKPDARGRFALAPVRRWLHERAPRAGEDEATQRLKMQRLELQTVAAERSLENARRDYIPRSGVGPTLHALIEEVRLSLEKRFVHELPPQWAGCNAIGIQQKNAVAVDAVSQSFREGKLPEAELEEAAPAVVPVSPQPSPSSDPMRELRARKLRAEVGLLELNGEVAAGLRIRMEEAFRTVDGAWHEVSLGIRQKFERELPFRHRGRSQAEIGKSYVDAIASIVARFRETVRPLSG